ncbi:MAG: hypothetical protein A2297_10245 [Elusimicrobia bacterium RIFOXYB2_FULL_48_7]|nr:MAG: hypothetical protein A2297_10245 [Elusimicrobia bacterium RIFOXYB2_FULL_48_7]
MADEPQRNKILASQAMNPSLLTSSKQVHGKQILIVKNSSEARRYEGFDGFMTGFRGIPLGVFTADCVPVFLADKKGTFAAVLHAGWKGLHGGIVENGVETLLKISGTESSGIIAGIGPHICGECYKVGMEFGDYFPESFKNGRMGLANEIVLRLKSKNIPEMNIDRAPSDGFCTFHNNDLFFSYRKGEKAARLLSAIML